MGKHILNLPACDKSRKWSSFIPVMTTYGVTCLCDASSVQQLEPVKGEELGQDFDVLHVCLTVPPAVVFFRAVQPSCHVPAQVAIVEAAHLEGVQENSKCGQQRPT